MPYAILDFETTATTSFRRTANPFDPRNKVIVKVFQHQGDKEVTCEYNREGLANVDLPWETFDTLVGHNIKFDLLYIWANPQLREWLRNGGKIFDTMVAEYLLTAQVIRFVPLDKLSLKYGGTLKDNRVTEYFNVGLGADYVDPDYLLPYAMHDITNTRIVYEAQLKQIHRKGLGPLMDVYMDHLLATTEMEANGLALDVPYAEELESKYTQLCDELAAKIEAYVPEDFRRTTEFSVDSNSHLSALLFNTPIRSRVHVATGEVYGPKAKQAGQPKYRWETVETKANIFSIPPRDKYGNELSASKFGVYHVGSEILDDLREQHKADPDVAAIVDLILDYREAKKLLTTYIRGVKIYTDGDEETGLLPLVQEDGLIHHTLNLVSTVTGRLSSKNPNAQNIPRALKRLVKSRFEKGRIIECDYSQLEVCLQAYLTQSDRMIRDIKSGVDFHCKRLAYAEEKAYEEVCSLVKEHPEIWGAKRTAAKTVSFQKAYGARAESLARTTGLPLKTVEKIFTAENNEYPEIELFVDGVMAAVEASRVPYASSLTVRNKDTGLVQVLHEYCGGIGYWPSPTGKRYHFLELGVESAKLREFKGDIFRYFSKPQGYNYPVQGLAADIVSMMVGRLFRGILKAEQQTPGIQDAIKLINEVHDSVILDVQDQFGNYVPHLKAVLEDVPNVWEQTFGSKFNVPISVEVKVGSHWGGDK